MTGGVASIWFQNNSFASIAQLPLFYIDGILNQYKRKGETIRIEIFHWIGEIAMQLLNTRCLLCQFYIILLLHRSTRDYYTGEQAVCGGWCFLDPAVRGKRWPWPHNLMEKIWGPNTTRRWWKIWRFAFRKLPDFNKTAKQDKTSKTKPEVNIL